MKSKSSLVDRSFFASGGSYRDRKDNASFNTSASQAQGQEISPSGTRLEGRDCAGDDDRRKMNGRMTNVGPATCALALELPFPGNAESAIGRDPQTRR